MKKLLCFLLSFVIACSSVIASADNQDQCINLSPKGLFDAFFAPIPTYRNIFELGQQGSCQEHIDDLIEKDERLTLYSTIGLGFQQAYLHFLKEDFTGEQLPWILNPEETAIQFLLYSPYSKSAKKDKPLSDIEAHRMAWSEVQSRFGLQLGTSLQDFEQKSMGTMNYQTVINAYQRRSFALQAFEFPLNKKEPLNVEQLKIIIQAKIEQLRRQNFLVAAKRATEFHDPIFSMRKTKPDGKTEDFQASILQYFSGAQVRFLSQDIKPNTKILSLNRKDKSPLQAWIKDWIKEKISKLNYKLTNYRLKNDLSSNSYMYQNHIRYPSSPTHTVEITIPNGSVYRMTEKDWSLFLSNLWLPDSDDLQKEPRDIRRYVLEVTNRDTMLADLQQTLFETVDKIKDETIARLQKRNLKNKELNARGTTLTDILRSNPIEAFKATAVNGLFWAGYLTHPAFWQAREVLATKLNKPELYWDGKGMAEKPTALLSRKEQKEIKKQEKIVKLKEDYRSILKSDRTKKTYFQMAKTTAITALLATAVISGLPLVAIDLPSLGLGGSQVGFSQESSTIGNSDLTGNDKSKAVMKIEMRDPSQKLPDMIYLFNEYDNHDNHADVAIQLPKAILYYDIKVETEPLFDSKYSIVPIAHLEGYQLVHLDLRYKGTSLPKKHYQLRQSYRSQFTYANVNSEYATVYSWRAYSYTSYYIKKTTLSRASSPELKNMNKKDIESVSSKIASYGYTELANALKTLSDKSGAVSYTDFSKMMAETGFYTFLPSKKSFKLRSIDYEDYKAFLREDGSLYYQCNGGNSLMQRLLTNLSNGTRVNVEAVSGFKVNSPIVTQKDAHMRTLVYDNTTPVFSQILDGTPLKMDPRNPQPPNPFDFSHTYDNYYAIENRASISESSKRTFILKRPDPLKLDPRKNQNIPIDSRHLQSLLKTAVTSLTGAMEDNVWLRRQELRSIGLGILPLSYILLKWASSELDIQQAYYEATKLKMRMSERDPNFETAVQKSMLDIYYKYGNLDQAFRSIIEEMAQTALASAKHANNLANQNSSSPIIDLGSGGIGLSVNELALYLAYLPWDANHSPKPACDRLLSIPADL